MDRPTPSFPASDWFRLNQTTLNPFGLSIGLIWGLWRVFLRGNEVVKLTVVLATLPRWVMFLLCFSFAIRILCLATMVSFFKRFFSHCCLLIFCEVSSDDHQTEDSALLSTYSNSQAPPPEVPTFSNKLKYVTIKLPAPSFNLKLHGAQFTDGLNWLLLTSWLK